MPRAFIIGLIILVIGLSTTLLVALWVGPWQLKNSSLELSASQARVTSLLDELSEIVNTAPESELEGAKRAIERAVDLNDQTETNLNSIQGTLRRIPQRIRAPFGGTSFSWDKEGSSRIFTDLRNKLREAKSLTSNASDQLGRTSLAMLDLNRRVTDVDARVNNEIENIVSKVSSLSEPHKFVSSIWLPILLSITTVVGGLSTIWLGWRKDRREKEELRLMVRVNEQNQSGLN